MGRVFNSRDLIKLVENDGWYRVSVNGDHHNFLPPKSRAV